MMWTFYGANGSAAFARAAERGHARVCACVTKSDGTRRWPGGGEVSAQFNTLRLSQSMVDSRSPCHHFHRNALVHVWAEFIFITWLAAIASNYKHVKWIAESISNVISWLCSCLAAAASCKQIYLDKYNWFNVCVCMWIWNHFHFSALQCSSP